MSGVYVYMHEQERLGGCGGILKFEIASEGQKQSRCSYMHNFSCPCLHLLCQLTLNFYERRY